MTAAVAQDRSAAHDLLLWGGAGAAALGLHAALVAWLLHEPILASSAPAAPAAVMIELAPAPVAAEPEQLQLAPDMVEQEQVLEAPEVPPDLPAPVVDEVAPPDPPPSPDIAEPLDDLMPQVSMTPVEVAEVPVPVTRPRTRPADLPKPPEPEPQPEKVARQSPPPQKEPPRERKVQARAEAPAAPTTAAPQNSQGASGSRSPANWRSKLMARLERAKRYPSGAQRRREEGVAYVSFTIDGDGRVLSAQLSRSSGHPELDKEVVALVHRASPLPPPPPGVPRTISAPVRFNIR
jgi:periplasmic protein TonB